jgi:hypothetical protein
MTAQARCFAAGDNPIANRFREAQAMRARWFVPVVVAVLSCGCTSLVIIPRDGDVITGTANPVPVTIRLAWPEGGVGMGPIVEVDGTRIPESALTYTSKGVTATVPLQPGAHAVRVRTAQRCWICVGGVGEFDLTRRFYVTTSATVSLR